MATRGITRSHLSVLESAMQSQDNERQTNLDQETDPWLTCPVRSMVTCQGRVGRVVDSRAKIRTVRFADGLIEEVPLRSCREQCAWEWDSQTSRRPL